MIITTVLQPVHLVNIGDSYDLFFNEQKVENYFLIANDSKKCTAMLYIKTLIYLMENIMKIRKSCKLMLSEKHILGQKSLNQCMD